MNIPITLAIIKPKIIKDNKVGKLLTMIEDGGFKIRAMKMTNLTYKDAQEFYKIHSNKPFYDSLCTNMSSGQVIPMILEKANAVTSFRKLIGATDPAEAELGTIRRELGTSIDHNAIHGSDSEKNAHLESLFFFSV